MNSEIRQTQPMRAVSFPALSALAGAVVRIEVRETGDGGIRLEFVDPNTGKEIGAVGFVDGPGKYGALGISAFPALRCGERFAGKSYRRKGER